MNFNFNRKQPTISANSSYSQMLVANNSHARSQRKLKALFVLAGVAFLGLVISFNLLSNSGNLVASSTESDSQTVSLSDKLSSVVNLKNASSNSTGTAVSSTSTDPSAAKNCTPAKSYLKPAKPVANSRSNSVISAQTIVSSYKVYGNSTNQINNQIFSCTPVQIGGNKFAASTDYAITWSVAYVTVSSNPGMCRVSSAGVGLNMSMVFPSWQPSKSASKQTKQQWNSFIAELKSHESEHAQINQRYANKVLAKLKNLPATSCSSIASQANAKANAVVNSMDSANKNLDSHTNHGANTGARL